MRWDDPRQTSRDSATSARSKTFTQARRSHEARRATLVRDIATVLGLAAFLIVILIACLVAPLMLAVAMEVPT